MAQLDITQAIILTIRNELRTALRAELKAQGFEADHIHPVTTVAECLDKVQTIDNALLILDWDLGPDQVLEALTENRRNSKVEAHPSFLITSKMDENILAIAAEYYVSKVHTGEISRNSIKEHLDDLVEEARHLSPLRQVLITVEKKRAVGDMSAAVKVLEQVLEKASDNTRLMLELAECYMETDDWDKAEALLKRAVGENPKSPRAMHLMARCYLKRGQIDGAIKALERAQLASPYNIERLDELGRIFLDINRPKDAKGAFDEILDFAPESKTGKLGKGASMLLMGEINEALAMLKDSANNRELAAMFNTAAICAIRQDKHDVAMNLYRTAAGILGNNNKIMARLLYNMGIGYVKWGKVDKSIECFEKSSDLDPNFADARHNLKAVRSVSQTAKKKKTAPTSKAATAEELGSNDPFASFEEAIAGELQGGNSTLSFNTDLDTGDDDLGD